MAALLIVSIGETADTHRGSGLSRLEFAGRLLPREKDGSWANRRLAFDGLVADLKLAETLARGDS
jgi:hypothetical protein